MDTRDTNRVNMFKTTADYLDQSNSIWSSMAPFTAAMDRLKANIAAIDAASGKQQTPSGAASGKEAARTALEDAAFLMSQALSVLGHTTSNHDLKARMSSSRSDWDRLVDQELSNRAASVLADAATHKTDLAAYNVTQTKIDDLSAAVDRFNSVRTSPRTVVAGRVAQTQSIPVLIRDTNTILLNETDPLVNLFQPTHGEFVAGYRAARVIVDRAATHTASVPPGTTTPPVTPH
jgi:hypothetical protein